MRVNGLSELALTAQAASFSQPHAADRSDLSTWLSEARPGMVAGRRPQLGGHSQRRSGRARVVVVRPACGIAISKRRPAKRWWLAGWSQNAARSAPSGPTRLQAT